MKRQVTELIRTSKTPTSNGITLGDDDMLFNSVLVNYYRNGSDSIAWHSDDEVEYGDSPLIASLTMQDGSLIDARCFEIRVKGDKASCVKSVRCEHGSLIVMGGWFQHNFSHRIWKITDEDRLDHVMNWRRINLTFRKILHVPETETKTAVTNKSLARDISPVSSCSSCEVDMFANKWSIMKRCDLKFYKILRSETRLGRTF